MLNGIVGYQLLDDGTPTSLGLILISAAAIFIGTGYIALDHAFSWTGFWDDTLDFPNRSYSLYTLYFLAPLVFLVVFFLLEAVLVLKILGEKRPMRKSEHALCSLFTPRESTHRHHMGAEQNHLSSTLSSTFHFEYQIC